LKESLQDDDKMLQTYVLSISYAISLTCL